jgi:hypothetical protein
MSIRDVINTIKALSNLCRSGEAQAELKNSLIHLVNAERETLYAEYLKDAKAEEAGES